MKGPLVVCTAAAWLSLGPSSGQGPESDDPLDTIIAVLAQARIEASQAAVVGDVRAVLGAEAAYRSSNGHYDELTCLARPRDCRATYTGGPFLAGDLASLGTKTGYRRQFHRGPGPDAATLRRQGASPTSTEAFAYTAVPVSAELGTRGFCGDHTGRVCYVEAGSPLVTNGSCASCEDLPVQGLGLLWRRARPRVTGAQREAVVAAFESDLRVRSWPDERKRLVLDTMDAFIESAGETLYGDEEACQRGDAETCVGLGRRRLERGEREDAAGYYRRACETGSEYGCFGLASYLTWRVYSAASDAARREFVEEGLGVAEPLLKEDPGNLDVLYYLYVLHNARAATTVDAREREEALGRSRDLLATMRAARAERTGHLGSSLDRFFQPSPPPPPRRPNAPVAPPAPRRPASASAPEGRPASATPVRLGGNIKQPTKLENVDPVYPDEARKARVQGTVILECVIDPDGRVSSAQVLRSIPLLDQAALDAVRQWVYEPTIVDGVAVPVVMTVTVRFDYR